MKQKWIDAFMDTAERFAQLSSAKRLKVGCVVVKEHRIISIGYNGTPTGWDNNCEEELFTYDERDTYNSEGWTYDPVRKGYFKFVTKDEVLHAEENALVKLARDGERANGSSLFCTHAPCIRCAKLIFGAGIKEVFYREDYNVTSGKDFLLKNNISVEKV